MENSNAQIPTHTEEKPPRAAINGCAAGGEKRTTSYAHRGTKSAP